MSDDKRLREGAGHVLDRVLDEELSALVDGELDAQRSSALRTRAAAEPALAERIAAFEGVGERLRARPGRELGSAARARLRVELTARIAGDRGDSAGDEPPEFGAARRGQSGALARLPSRRRWLGPALGAVAAAALALFFVLGRASPPTLPGGQATPDFRAAQADEAAGAGEAAPIPEEEIELYAVALELETLADEDFYLIDNLELLEWMARQANEDRSG